MNCYLYWYLKFYSQVVQTNGIHTFPSIILIDTSGNFVVIIWVYINLSTIGLSLKISGENIVQIICAQSRSSFVWHPPFYCLQLLVNIQIHTHTHTHAHTHTHTHTYTHIHIHTTDLLTHWFSSFKRMLNEWHSYIKAFKNYDIFKSMFVLFSYFECLVKSPKFPSFNPPFNLLCLVLIIIFLMVSLSSFVLHFGTSQIMVSKVRVCVWNT